MVTPTNTEGLSPLDKLRRQRQNVLEADAVGLDIPTSDASPPAKPTPIIPPPPTRGRSADPTMVPIPAPPPKGEATIITGEGRRRSADPTMVPIPAPPPKGEATMRAGSSRRGSAKLTMTPTPAPPKGEATMRTGSRRRGSAKLTMTPTPPPPKGEATMAPGADRPLSADPTMVPIPAQSPKGEATMVPGESHARSADPFMVSTPALPPHGEATMMPGASRRPSGDPAMAPIPAPAAKGEATTRPGEPRRQSVPPLKKPADPAHEPKPDIHAFSKAAVKAFIAELRSLAMAQKMEYTIIQPEDLKFDFFTYSKALRVAFTGRGQAVDRIVIRELSSSANTNVHYVGGKGVRSLLGPNSARRQTLELESGKKDFGLKDTLLNVATILDADKNDLEWNQPHVLEEYKTPTPESRIVIEAFYFDADSKRNWVIELVNSTPSTAGETANNTSGGDLTPAGARRLVRVLLKSMHSIAGPQSSFLTFPTGI